jgi:hypothetical protein
MRRMAMKRATTCAIAVLLVLALVSGVVLANGGPERLRQVIGAGGTSASAGDLAVHGTLGQPVAGGVASCDGVVVGQGFWAGGAATMHWVYLPLVVR